MTLFRIMQEQLNILTHADAEHISIEILQAGSQLTSAWPTTAWTYNKNAGDGITNINRPHLQWSGRIPLFSAKGRMPYGSKLSIQISIGFGLSLQLSHPFGNSACEVNRMQVHRTGQVHKFRCADPCFLFAGQCR